MTRDLRFDEFMQLGILADTHDEIERTMRAIETLRAAGAEALVHCGDLASAPIVTALAGSPAWFALGNHDADAVPELEAAAREHGVTCVGWGGEFLAGGKRIAVAHGHLTMDVEWVLKEQPDYFLFGHAHAPSDGIRNGIRAINPGALHRTDRLTVAMLDLATGETRFFDVAE